MMKIYVETSVISYLAARPSADVIKANRQHFSYLLWKKRSALSLVISEAVLTEASLGDEAAAQSRLGYCKELVIVSSTDTVALIVQHLLQSKAIPSKAYTDAVHIAIATAADVDLIASWNFRHIVGPIARRNIEDALRKFGDRVPVIATPEEILESLP
jgi:hypothetical protein